jgi:hypothetical protein
MDLPTALQYGRDALDVVGAAASLYFSGKSLAAAAAPRLVDMALDRAEPHPAVMAALVKYRPQIEEFFDAVDKRVRERLDAAPAAAPAPAPAPKPAAPTP